MSFRPVAAAAIAAVLYSSACATVMKMPYAKGAPPIEPGKALFLMTATLRNVYEPSYQPKVLVINVEREGATEAKDRFNFKMDDEGRQENESLEVGNNYLIRMDLGPGTYVIRGITCVNNSFLVHAVFFAPLHERLVVTGPGVYYLGHIDATVRERAGGEFRAGPPAPLIDQALAGASGGTFDVTISDRWEIDRARFGMAFAVLRGVGARQAILPPFDRRAAQAFWEAH